MVTSKRQFQVSQEIEEARHIDLEEDGGQGHEQHHARPETRDLLALVADQVAIAVFGHWGGWLAAGRRRARGRGRGGRAGFDVRARIASAGAAVLPAGADGYSPARPLAAFAGSATADCAAGCRARASLMLKSGGFVPGSPFAKFVVLGGADLLILLQQLVGVGPDGTGRLQRLAVPRGAGGGGVPRYTGALAGGASGWPGARPPAQSARPPIRARGRLGSTRIS